MPVGWSSTWALGLPFIGTGVKMCKYMWIYVVNIEFYLLFVAFIISLRLPDVVRFYRLI